MASEKANKLWSVYMLRTERGLLYTGISTDVARRFRQHVAGRGARCLRGAQQLQLCWQLEVTSHGHALRAEHAIKSLPATEKRKLCACDTHRRRFVETVGILA